MGTISLFFSYPGILWLDQTAGIPVSYSLLFIILIMTAIASPIVGSLKIPGCSKPVLPTTIIRLQGDSNYTWLHLHQQSKPILISKSLKWFEALLPDFVRVHKSDLINPSFIQALDYANATTLELSLANEQIVRVSRRRIDPVLLKLKRPQSRLVE